MSEGTVSKPRRVRKVQLIDAPTGAVFLGNGLVAYIDPEDVALVSGRFWHAIKSRRSHYARCSAPKGTPKTLMHVLIMGTRDGFQIDHKNGNGLDNRRENLRWATSAQNMQNARIRPNKQSGLRGVRRGTRAQKWSAAIRANGTRHHLGSFVTSEEAARVYDEAAKRLHGEFAQLNFPETT